MKWETWLFVFLGLWLVTTFAFAELLDYSEGKFTEATAKVSSSELQDRLNQVKAKVGQVTERCQAEVAGVYAELDAVQKDTDIAEAVEIGGATLAEAKDSVKPIKDLPIGIEVDEGLYP